MPPINDVDVFAHDLGFIAIVEAGELRRLQPDGRRRPRRDATAIRRPIRGSPTSSASCARSSCSRSPRPSSRRSAISAIATTRKHARLKYTIDDRGLDWFVGEIARRMGFALEPARPFEFTSSGDRFGWIEGHDGRWHLTLRIERGRVADSPQGAHLTGLREIARVHRGDFRLTPNQNLIIANVAPSERQFIDALVVRHGLDAHARATPVRRDALACVALPTCPLAMAEAERYLPDFSAKVEGVLASARTARPAAGAAHHRLPERLRPTVPRRGRADRQGAGTLQPVSRRRRARPAPERAVPRERRRGRRSWRRSTMPSGALRRSREPGERFGDFAWRAGLVAAGTTAGAGVA